MFMKSNVHKLPGCFSTAFGVSLLFQVAMFTSATIAQDTFSKLQADVLENSLEGVRFVGPFGAEGEVDPEEDTFTFKDGKFATGSCLKWGFAPAPYWVRRGADGLQFLAELVSPEHGTMRYEGVFNGKELTVVGYWKKERWYWTIERTYRGKGRPVASEK